MHFRRDVTKSIDLTQTFSITEDELLYYEKSLIGFPYDLWTKADWETVWDDIENNGYENIDEEVNDEFDYEVYNYELED